MIQAIRALDELLRGERTRAEHLRLGMSTIPVRLFLAVAIVLGALYGFFMGWYATSSSHPDAWKQVIASTVKLPALFLLGGEPTLRGRRASEPQVAFFFAAVFWPCFEDFLASPTGLVEPGFQLFFFGSAEDLPFAEGMPFVAALCPFARLLRSSRRAAEPKFESSSFPAPVFAFGFAGWAEFPLGCSCPERVGQVKPGSAAGTDPQ